MSPSAGTQENSQQGPITPTRFQQNILLGLALYYIALTVVAFSMWSFLPVSLHAWLDDAVHALTGQLGAVATSLADVKKSEAPPVPPHTVVLMTLIAGISALAFTLPVSWVYMFTRQKKGYSQSVVHSLVLMPVVVAIVAALVRSSVALAFSLAGVVAAVRFRTTLEDSKDAVFVFAVVALGLACGVELEVAAVLSILWVVITLALWYTDYARTPPALEGARAEQHMQRALAIANRTSQFVARLDREILESMAPAQLDALQSRVTKRREELEEKKKKKKGGSSEAEPAAEDEGPRFDGRLTITVSDPDAAQPAIEALFETHLKRWKMIRVERDDGQARIVYAIRPKKGTTIESVAETVERDGAPYVASTEVERWI
jgi:uncharacterized protein DUF4956